MHHLVDCVFSNWTVYCTKYMRMQQELHPVYPCVLTKCCVVLCCVAPCCMQRVSRKAMSSLLQSTLEAVVDVDKFPKASVDVNVLVLQVGHHL